MSLNLLPHKTVVCSSSSSSTMSCEEEEEKEERKKERRKEDIIYPLLTNVRKLNKKENPSILYHIWNVNFIILLSIYLSVYLYMYRIYVGDKNMEVY